MFYYAIQLENFPNSPCKNKIIGTVFSIIYIFYFPLFTYYKKYLYVITIHMTTSIKSCKYFCNGKCGHHKNHK